MKFLVFGTMTMLAPNPAPLAQMAAGIIGMERIDGKAYSTEEDLELIEGLGYYGFRVTKENSHEVVVTICKISGGCDDFEVETDDQGKLKNIEEIKAYHKAYYEKNKEKISIQHKTRYERIKKSRYDDPNSKNNIKRRRKEQLATIMKNVDWDLPYLKLGIGGIKKTITPIPDEMLEFEPAANQETPAQQAETDEMYQMVWSTIKTMTDIDQEIAKLILDGIKDNKIANALELPPDEILRVRKILQDVFK